MLLPFEGNLNQLESNKVISTSQLSQLKIRIAKDAKHRSVYVHFMNGMLKKGVAGPVPEKEVDEKKSWYTPHHGMYHLPRKKIREVFDSLFSVLLQGHDLTSLVVVDGTSADWQYGKNSENPADCASPCTNSGQLIENKLWLQGPKFLSIQESRFYFKSSDSMQNTAATGGQAVIHGQNSADEGSSDDNIYFKSRNFSITQAEAGVKKHVNVHAVVTEQCLDLSRFSRVSGWLKRIKALCAMYARVLKTQNVLSSSRFRNKRLQKECVRGRVS